MAKQIRNPTRTVLIAVLLIGATMMSGCIDDAEIEDVVVIPVITPDARMTPELTPSIDTHNEIIDITDGDLTITGYVSWENNDFTELEYEYAYINTSDDTEIYIIGTITQKRGSEPICDSTYEWFIPDDYIPLGSYSTFTGEFSNVTCKYDDGTVEVINLLHDDFDATHPISVHDAVLPFMTFV